MGHYLDNTQMSLAILIATEFLEKIIKTKQDILAQTMILMEIIVQITALPFQSKFIQEIKMLKLARRNEGQSTIEFLLVSIFAFGILFVFIQLAINLTGGFLVHYATFMSSRTYMVWDDGNYIAGQVYNVTAVSKAREVFEEYNVKPFGVYDSDAELIINTPAVTNGINEYVGARYLYTQPMSVFAYFGGGIDSTMHSESFLGKEPTRGECWARVREAMEGVGFSQDKHREFVTLFDNGC